MRRATPYRASEFQMMMFELSTCILSANWFQFRFCFLLITAHTAVAHIAKLIFVNVN